MVFVSQPQLPPLKLDRRFAFGGPLLKGHARRARPISRNFPLLLAFESTSRGGSSSLLHNERWILALVQRLARRFQIRIYSARISSLKDLQILVHVKKRSNLHGFLRSLGGLIPRKILEKKQMRGRNWQGSYWKQRPFSWLLHWDGLFRKIQAHLKSGGRSQVQAAHEIRVVSENFYGHQSEHALFALEIPPS
jgi:hypothetical protein